MKIKQNDLLQKLKDSVGEKYIIAMESGTIVSGGIVKDAFIDAGDILTIEPYGLSSNEKFSTTNIDVSPNGNLFKLEYPDTSFFVLEIKERALSKHESIQLSEVAYIAGELTSRQFIRVNVNSEEIMYKIFLEIVDEYNSFNVDDTLSAFAHMYLQKYYSVKRE